MPEWRPVRPQLGGQGRGLRGSLPEEGGSFWRLGGSVSGKGNSKRKGPGTGMGTKGERDRKQPARLGDVSSRAGRGRDWPDLTSRGSADVILRQRGGTSGVCGGSARRPS